MSRLPPKIEQVIDGTKVPGWQIIPITRNTINYNLRSEIFSKASQKQAGQSWFLSATDATGDTVWDTLVYSKEFEPTLETDVQEIYPVDFYFEGDTKIVIKFEYYTETERVYKVNLADGVLCA